MLQTTFTQKYDEMVLVKDMASSICNTTSAVHGKARCLSSQRKIVGLRSWRAVELLSRRPRYRT